MNIKKIEQHVCCDFCPKVNTSCARLQGLHCAQRACLDCLRTAVQMLEQAQGPTCPSCKATGLRGTITCRDCGGSGLMNQCDREKLTP